MAVWLSGNALVSINEVTLHQAWLELGWTTVCEQVSKYVTASEVNSALYSLWDGKTSISF